MDNENFVGTLGIVLMLMVLAFGIQWVLTAIDPCSAFSNGSCNSDLKGG